MRIAVALVLLVAAALPSTAAAASRVAVPNLAGEIKAAAFSGGAVIVARRPDNRGLRVERLVPGSAPQVVLRTTLRAADDEAAVAASPDAVAVSLRSEDPEDQTTGFSRVLVGPPGGPLREVARCDASAYLPPVAVDGTRVMWGEGSCAVPADRPREIGPGAVAIGDVDPAAPVTRAALPEERVALTAGLRGETAVAGLLRPSLLTFYGGEVRRVEGDRLGPRVLGGAGEFVEIGGVLRDGTAVAGRYRAFDEDDDEEACARDVVAIPPAATGAPPRTVPLGRCPRSLDTDDEFFFSSSFEAAGTVVAAGDRIVARTAIEPGRGGREYYEGDGDTAPAQIVSVRADGGDRRILARGTKHRTPSGLIRGSDRLGWLLPRCGGNAELRTADPAGPAAERPVAGCRADVLTRRARVRRAGTRLRLRCPRGCKGRLVDRTVCGRDERSRTFRLRPGVHTLRMPLSRRARQRGSALIEVRAENAPDRFRRVRLTGRRAAQKR